VTLPAEYTPLPFLGSRGIPQTVPFDVGSRRLRVTIVASVTDLPALRSLPATQVVFDGAAEERRRPTAVPGAPADRFSAAPPDTLAPSVLRPQLVVSDDGATLGSRPILVGSPLLVGSTAAVPLLVEVYFDSLVLTVGSLSQPGELGGAITAGIRVRNVGVERFETAPGPLARRKPTAPKPQPAMRQPLGTAVLVEYAVALDLSDLVTVLPGQWWSA
jgi:hypothetical protein